MSDPFSGASRAPFEHSVALRCHALVKRYSDVTAVDGLDLAIAAGECYGLLGPNGAGKTTTVEIFEGLTEPTAGEVEVLGEHWRRDDRALRSRLGIQLQEAKFPDKLRVREVIELFRSFYPHGLDPQEALRRVSLVDKARAQVRNLSGGQRQRLSVACALVGDPEVLFLDEPTTGLDPTSRRQIWEIVEALKRGGRTILLTTHYMEEAERLCDRVGIVDRGRKLAEGTPRQLIGTLGAEQVIEVEVEGRPASRTLEDLAAIGSVHWADGSIRLTVGDVPRAIPSLLALLAEGELELRRLATHQATLEDVFLELTGRGLEQGGEAR